MNEQEFQRQAKHRLAMLRHAEEITGNVAATPTAETDTATPPSASPPQSSSSTDSSTTETDVAQHEHLPAQVLSGKIF